MRESMGRLTPTFSSNRSLREYTEHHYLPLAHAFLERAGSKTLVYELQEWKRHLEKDWHSVRFGELSVMAAHDRIHFTVQLYLNEILPDAVQVEIFAEPLPGGEPERSTMHRGSALIGSRNGFLYSGDVAASRPATDYTVRVIPFHPEAQVPLEAAQILWQR